MQRLISKSQIIAEKMRHTKPKILARILMEFAFRMSMKHQV